MSPPTACVQCDVQFKIGDFIVPLNSTRRLAHLSCVTYRCQECGHFGTKNEIQSFRFPLSIKMCVECDIEIQDNVFFVRKNGTTVHTKCANETIDGGGKSSVEFVKQA